MPAGPGPMSFLYFAGAKAIGYTRTAIGIAVGLLYGGIWIIVIDRFATGSSGVREEILYFTLLIPIRFAEWSLVIWIFFERGWHDRVRLRKYAAFGILCSYLLDAVGVGGAMALLGGLRTG
jgi:hypothetical protein